MFTRGMPRLLRAQFERRWERDPRGGRSSFAQTDSSREVRNPSEGSEDKLKSRSDGPGELTGKTLFIVGLGRIGEALAGAGATVRGARGGGEARPGEPA